MAGAPKENEDPFPFKDILKCLAEHLPRHHFNNQDLRLRIEKLGYDVAGQTQFDRHINGTRPYPPFLPRALLRALDLEKYGITVDLLLDLPAFCKEIEKIATNQPNGLGFLDMLESCAQASAGEIDISMSRRSTVRLVGGPNAVQEIPELNPGKYTFECTVNLSEFYLLVLEYVRGSSGWYCWNCGTDMELPLQQPHEVPVMRPITISAARGEFSVFAIASPKPFDYRLKHLLDGLEAKEPARIAADRQRQFIEETLGRDKGNLRVGQFRYVVP